MIVEIVKMTTLPLFFIIYKGFLLLLFYMYSSCKNLELLLYLYKLLFYKNF